MLCSFHDVEHKKKKLSYKANIEIKDNDIIIKNDNHKTGYIKADQLYYFNKKNIKYYIVGNIKQNMLNELYKLITILVIERKDKEIIVNLTNNKRGGNYG